MEFASATGNSKKPVVPQNVAHMLPFINKRFRVGKQVCAGHFTPSLRIAFTFTTFSLIVRASPPQPARPPTSTLRTGGPVGTVLFPSGYD